MTRAKGWSVLPTTIEDTLYIGYTAIGYGAKSVKGWVLRCPDLPTVNLIGYNVKSQLQRGVKSVIMRM